jgi:hypothetical protein
VIYGDFPSIPLILVITLQNRKTLFCVFLRFRDLPDSNWPGIFWTLIFYHEKHLEHKKSRGRSRGPFEHRWRGPSPGRTIHVCLSLGPPMSSIFVSWCSAWRKNAYIKTLLDDHEMRQRRNTKHRNRGCSNEDWRGNAAGVAPDTSPRSPKPAPSSPPWRGSNPPLDYEFVAVACSISLLCFNS